MTRLKHECFELQPDRFGPRMTSARFEPLLFVKFVGSLRAALIREIRRLASSRSYSWNSSARFEPQWFG